MFKITRVIELEKGFLESYIQRFQNQSLIEQTPGFVKKEIWINDQNPHYDVLHLSTLFIDRESFIAWEKSPEHLALHQNKQVKDKLDGLIRFKLEHYTSQ